MILALLLVLGLCNSGNVDSLLDDDIVVDDMFEQSGEVKNSISQRYEKTVSDSGRYEVFVHYCTS